MDVVITSDPKKLPPEILGLQDQSQPLPPGAAFFEQRFTFAGLAWTALIGVVLAVAGLLTLLFFVALLVESFGPTTVAYSQFDTKAEFWSLAVAAVLMFGSYLMLSSLAPAARLAWSGRPSRYGITLLGDRLISYSLFDTTIIPRDKFSAIADGKVEYILGDNKKSFNLPDIAGNRRPQLEAAIRDWKAAED